MRGKEKERKPEKEKIEKKVKMRAIKREKEEHNVESFSVT